MLLKLAAIAHARSGDKADRADIGLFAWDADGYALLREHVTAERLAAHFAHLLGGADASRVRLWPLPNLLALKIVLDGALGGGAAASLRSDNLGKTVGAQLLRMSIEVPDTAAQRALDGAQRAIDAF
jgi:hypothetical protein